MAVERSAVVSASERVVEILIIFADADREIVKVRKQSGWEIHTRAPRKRIRPLIVSA